MFTQVPVSAQCKLDMASVQLALALQPEQRLHSIVDLDRSEADGNSNIRRY